MSEFTEFLKAVERSDIDAARAALDQHPEFIGERDEIGATALHYAAFEGRREMVRLLLDRGADINARDAKFSGTPAGWAIEYMREMGAFLGIELNDFAYAIEQGDVRWAARLLARFPRLRDASNKGQTFRALADQTNDPEIIKLFRS